MALSIFKNRYSSADAKFISDKAFYAVVAATLLFGFAVYALEVILLGDIISQWVYGGGNYLIFVICYFVMAIAGVCINSFSRKPLLSFIGYCLVVLPIGAVLALVVPYQSLGVVRSAFLVTTILAVVFGLLAVLYPRFFYSVWKILSLSLLIALIWSLIAMFTGAYFTSGYVWLDWLVVLIFCCYIGFDISLAKSRPKTLDNAVDSACGLYLDIINLFIRLLAIFGRND